MSAHGFHEAMSLRLSAKIRGQGVLVDGCGRCEEHAADPLGSLDREHIAALWRERNAVESTGSYDGVHGYRSILDSQACRALGSVIRFLEYIGLGRLVVLERLEQASGSNTSQDHVYGCLVCGGSTVFKRDRLGIVLTCVACSHDERSCGCPPARGDERVRRGEAIRTLAARRRTDTIRTSE